MQIDGNPLAIRQNQLDREGLRQEAMRLRKSFSGKSGKTEITVLVKKNVRITETVLNV